MFSPIGKKKLLLEIKRAPEEKREEVIQSLSTKLGFSRSPSMDESVDTRYSRKFSPARSMSRGLSRGLSTDSIDSARSGRGRARTPLIQTVPPGCSSTRNLEEILEEKTMLGSVAEKIAQVAIRYRRERDSVALRPFQTNSMTYDEFREHLKRSFRLTFTDEEFDCVKQLFDNNGDSDIDGSEFLVCFTKLATVKKAKIAAQIRQNQQQYIAKIQEDMERKQLEYEKKMESVVDYNYTEEIRKGVIEKMTLAAKKYDRNHPSAVSLDGFQGAFMKPAVFREMLKRTFGLQCTPQELGALIHIFDKNNDGEIECSEFLLQFFKFGFQARNEEIAAQRAKQAKMNAEAEAERIRKLQAQEEKMELKVDYDFSEADEARMHEKIAEAAKKYDKNHPASVSLEGFDVKFMKPGVFREMLKRTFNLHLTPKELGAAVRTYDSHGDGTIPCQEFLVKFFQIGYEERNRERLEQLTQNRIGEIEARKEQEEKLKAAANRSELQLPNSFSDAEKQSALDKLKIAATKYDKNHPAAVSLKGFEVSFMTAGVFREMLKRTFNIKLSRAELLALVKQFEDKANENHVNCPEFLTAFFKLGFEERNRIHSEQLQAQREAERVAAEAAQKAAEQKAEALSLEVDYNYTEMDRTSALDKMTTAATKYDKNHPSSVGLQGFDGATMAPHVFKEMLFRTFNLKLTPKELGALILHFDKDGDKNIDCGEFLNVFFKLGFEQRSQWHRDQIIKQRELAAARKLEAERRLLEQEQRNDISVEYDYSDVDMENIKRKITEAAVKYDKHHPASVSLDGFSCTYLTAGQFREMIKRTFTISLNGRELAAMLQFFDADKDGTITCEKFLTKFFRIGFNERNRLHKEALEKQRAAIKQAKIEAEEKLAAQWAKVEEDVRVDWDYSQADSDSVMKKLVEAAAKYDKTSAAAPSLEGFAVIHLTPALFREMLKRTFNLIPTPKELAALIKKFEHPDHPQHVDCNMFVINFIQIGINERRKQLAAQWTRQREIEAQRKSEEARKKKIQDQRLNLMVNDDFSDKERRSALAKMREAAFKYDKTMPGAVDVTAFDALYLTPLAFKEVLKRTFNLNLSPKELGALVAQYDKNKENRVISKEFLNDFIKIGIEERNKMRLIQIEKNRAAEKVQKYTQEKKLAEADQRMELEVPTDYSERDQKDAFEKLTLAAKKYDKNHPSAMSLEGFEAATLTYGQFREIVKRTFNVLFNPGELAAIVDYFDKKKEGFIRSQDFLLHFFKLGFHERNKEHSEALQKQRLENEQRERERKEKLAAQWAKMELDVDWNFSEEDRQSALAKITVAAREYDPNHPSSMSLQAFRGASMTPAVFREMIRRVMGIKLTDRELAAMVTEFDRNHDRKIDCAEFMVKFTTIGFAERDRIRQSQRKQRKQHEKAVIEEKEQKLKAQEVKVEANVDYDFTEEEFKSALEKIRVAAAAYDKNHPSAVGLDGFQGSSLTPGVFREMMKRTFNVKLNPKELGAAVKFFDSDGNGQIDSAEFLKHFYKLQRLERSHVRRQRIQAERNVEEKLKEEVMQRVRKAEEEEAQKLTFDKNDEKTLMDKLREQAQLFAVDSAPFVEPMQAFKGPALPPVAFREVFQRVFFVKLTYPEIGALLSVFDEAGTGTIDGHKFLNAFYRLGRLEEKYLFGEIKEDLTLDCLKPSAALFEPSLQRSYSSVSSATTKSRKSKKHTSTISIQASEAEIDAFTSQTLDQSWMVPNLQSQSLSRASSAAFDDFEPMPRIITTSPSSKKEPFPMPEPGSPQKPEKVTKPATSPIKTRKKKSASLKNKFESYEIKIEPETTPSDNRRQDNSTIATASMDDTQMLTQESSIDTHSQTLPITKKEQNAVKKKKKAKSDAPGAFFFPALLSTPPVLNVAPVTTSYMQRDAMFLEDQF